MSTRISLKIHKKEAVKVEQTEELMKSDESSLSILEQSKRDKALEILNKKLPSQYHDQIKDLESETLQEAIKILQPHATAEKVLKLYHAILCKKIGQ